MDFKDYYKILGLTPSATQEEIKRTYKKLARKYHPDVSEEADATNRFQEISEAYEVLKNKEKRPEYDELWEYVNNPNKFTQRNNTGSQGRFDTDFSAQSGFEDLLRSIFGEQRGFNASASGMGARGFDGAHFTANDFNLRGRDSRYDLGITLEEAYSGGSRSLRLSTPSGNKTINVKIPKGITEGQELRLKGQGEAGRGNNNSGDLYLKLTIEKHSLFEVDGDDVTLVLPVAPWEAALGTSLEVPTLGGKVNLKIPANSQNGSKLRLKGRGLGEGDQLVILKLVNPKLKTDQEKAAYETLRAAFDFNPRTTMVRSS